MVSDVIDVDANGRAADGSDFSDVAAPDAVKAGFVINKPVTLRFPDGTLKRTTQARITPKGMKVLAQKFGN